MRKIQPKRAKPSVADVNANAALANINEKIRILEQIADAGGAVASHGPRSTRAFLRWTSETAKLPPGVSCYFGRTSGATLKKYTGLAELVRTLTDKCAAANRGGDKVLSSDNRVASLKRSKSIAVLLRQIVEAELARSRRECIKINNARAQCEAQLKSLTAATSDRVSTLEAEVEQLRAENARLIASARKIVLLKPPIK